MEPAAVGGLLVVVFAGTVLATTATGLSATTPYRGTLGNSLHVNIGDMKFQTKGPVDLVDRTITFAAGATSGWHSHPGVVLIVVASRSLVRYFADCSSEVIPTGAAFVESGDDPGLERNEGTIDAVTYVTFIAPRHHDPRFADRPGQSGLLRSVATGFDGSASCSCEARTRAGTSVADEPSALTHKEEVFA